MNRSQVLAYRIHAQQLDRAEAPRAITEAAIFDFGVQDTGRDGASWALANRGVPVRDAAELEASPEVVLVWTLRASPHYYRRTDLPEVLVATSPLSDRDAAKRVVGADKPLKEAGIPILEGLNEVATQMRRVVTRPLVKGEVSTQLTALLDPPYVRYCRGCEATHSWEVPFRIGALYAGLELEPGTSSCAPSHSWLAETDARTSARPTGCTGIAATDPQLPGDFSARPPRTTSPRSSIRRSPRSRTTGRRTRSKPPSPAGRLGHWARWAILNKIKICCDCSADSTSSCRARIEI